VIDRQGRAVASIRVQGLPRGKDVGWSPAAVTDSEGRFRLSLIAPAEYGFILSWNGRTVVTPEEDDPARLRIAVEPGQRRDGIEILFLRDAWDSLETSGTGSDLQPWTRDGSFSCTSTVPQDSCLALRAVLSKSHDPSTR